MNEHDLTSACKQFRVAPPSQRARGDNGNHGGVSLGASVEFFDFRSYVPGDDLRHIDWAAFGRTGDLTIRRFREEVQPRCDVLLDGSRSMTIDDGRKGDLARELATFFVRSSQGSGRQARLHVLGDSVRRCHDAATADLSGHSSTLFGGGAHMEVPAHGLRVVISDFLSPDSPVPVLRQIAARAAMMVVIRILGPWEAAPDADALWSMHDAESGAELPVGVTERLRRRYIDRIDAIRDSMRGFCASVGAHFVDVCADASISEVLSRDFLPREVVVPA